MATATESAVDFNLRLLEMVRDNTNSAFDFARRLIAVTSPSEFLELSVAQARKQFESFTEQTQHLAALAQKVAAETVAPLQSGMMSTFNRLDRAGVLIALAANALADAFLRFGRRSCLLWNVTFRLSRWQPS